MKTRPITRRLLAFTLVELLLVLAIVFILAALLLPTHSGPNKSYRVVCMVNQKQIGLGLLMWAGDHGNRFPAQVSVTNGGSLELIGSGSPAAHFQALKEMLPNPRLLLCPTDKGRLQAFHYAEGLSNRNLSYFLSVDAKPTFTNTQFVILTGDRNLQVGKKPVTPGLLPLTTNAAVAWTDELHKNMARQGGNLLFVDGHVAWSNTNLPALIRDQGLATNRLAFP